MNKNFSSFMGFTTKCGKQVGRGGGVLNVKTICGNPVVSGVFFKVLSVEQCHDCVL